MSLSVLNLLETGVRDIQLTRYAALASSVIIVYDHLITIDAEVTLIWRSSWSLGKVLFIINRYYTLLSVAYYDYALFSPYLTDEFCLIFFKWQGWTGLFAFVIAEIILQMRLYALYFLNKKVLFLMVFLFVGSVSASGVILALLLQKITMVDSHPGAGIVFCTPTGLSHSFWTFWVPLLGFETFLCIMALFRGFQTFKKDGSLFQSGRHLVRILIRDSVLFYLVMFGAYFTNVLMWLLARQTLLEVPIGFSVALSCVLGNRIILNVRQVNRDLDLTKTRQKKRRRRPGSTSWVDRAAGDSASVYPGGNGGGNRGQVHATDNTNSGRINPSRPRGDVEDPVDPRSEDYQTKFGLDADSDFEEEDDIKESADSADRFVDGILDSYVDIDVEADLDRSF